MILYESGSVILTEAALQTNNVVVPIRQVSSVRGLSRGGFDPKYLAFFFFLFAVVMVHGFFDDLHYRHESYATLFWAAIFATAGVFCFRLKRRFEHGVVIAVPGTSGFTVLFDNRAYAEQFKATLLQLVAGKMPAPVTGLARHAIRVAAEPPPESGWFILWW